MAEETGEKGRRQKVGAGGSWREKTGREIKVILISRRKSWFDQLTRTSPALDHITEELEAPKLLA